MKPHLILTLLSALFLASCSDNHDELMKDQIGDLEEITGVLNKVADGSMSSSEAAGKIEKLGADGKDFMKRKEVLNKDLSPEEAEKLMTKYRDESSKALKDFMLAVNKLSKSGRMTPELSEAIANMKN